MTADPLAVYVDRGYSLSRIRAAYSAVKEAQCTEYMIRADADGLLDDARGILNDVLIREAMTLIEDLAQLREVPPPT